MPQHNLFFLYYLIISWRLPMYHFIISSIIFQLLQSTSLTPSFFFTQVVYFPTFTTQRPSPLVIFMKLVSNSWAVPGCSHLQKSVQLLAKHITGLFLLKPTKPRGSRHISAYLKSGARESCDFLSVSGYKLSFFWTPKQRWIQQPLLLTNYFNQVNATLQHSPQLL